MEKKKKWIIASVCVCAVIVICALGLSLESRRDMIPGTVVEEIQRISGQTPTEWSMSGFAEEWHVDKKTIVKLSNNQENKGISLKYIITWETGDEYNIYETDGIEAGNHIPWNPAEYLPKGETKITIREVPTYKDGRENMEFPYTDQFVTVYVK